jgi:tetratricopeptide (TPR) repeat protein
MRIFRTALHHGTTGLLLIAIVAGLGCRSNKPAAATQTSQAVTPAAKAQPVSFPASKTQPLSAAAVTPGVDPPPEATDHFAQGKKLIEDNCVECMGGNRSGLEQGINEMQKAIDLGYQPAKDPYKLLEDAYANLRIFSEDKEERKSLEAKQKEIYERLYELDPRDPQILEDYSMFVATTNDEKLKVLEQAVEIDPKRAKAQFLLSLSLIQKKDFANGISALQEAVKNESHSESLENEVVRTLEALDQNGCAVPFVDQEHWNEEANSASSKENFGAGDPKAIPEFKERFLKFTNSLSCPTQTVTAPQ